MLFKFESRNKSYEITIEEVVVKGEENQRQTLITTIRTLEGDEAFGERNTYKVQPQSNEQLLTFDILQKTFDEVVKFALADEQSWKEFNIMLKTLPRSMLERMLLSLYKVRDMIDEWIPECSEENTQVNTKAILIRKL